MRQIIPLALSAAVLLAALASAAARAEHPAIGRAERAVEAGAVDPGRDLAPLLEALRAERSVDEKRALVDFIGDLGAADGPSPNAVKAYLRQEAPEVLLHVARTGGDPFLQGEAISALRGMGVSRAILEEAAAIAEADPNEFVQSRGEILRNYIAGLPDEDEAAGVRDVDLAAAPDAIALLDRRGIAVSTESLRTAAGEAQPEVVAALLAAGVAPDTGVTDLNLTPLYMATFVGCSSQGAETDWLVETVQHLLGAGADLEMTDQNGNTALMSAAQMCGPRIVGLLLDAGARYDYRNGSGVTPLVMALIMQKTQAAEVLVARGARMTPDDVTMASGMATSAEAKEVIRRASRTQVERRPGS